MNPTVDLNDINNNTLDILGIMNMLKAAGAFELRKMGWIGLSNCVE